MRDPDSMFVGEQAGEGKTDDELRSEWEAEEIERQEFIAAWKEMYRRKGVDPDTYHLAWDEIFEGERGE